MNSRADLRRIACEYVIGTLDAAERADWRARMVEDAEVAALVALWEQRLAPLNELSAPARPPEDLFDRILSNLPPLPEEVQTQPQAIEVTEPDVSGTADVTAEEGVGPSDPAGLVPAGDSGESSVPTEGEAGAVEAPVVPSGLDDSTPAETAPEGERGAVEESPLSRTAPLATPVSGEASVSDVAAPSEAANEASPQQSDVSEEPPPVTEGLAEPLPSAPARGESPDATRGVAELAPVSPPFPEPAGTNPWRLASGVLMLALLVGGGAFAYRELHHRPAPPPPEPPKQAEVVPEPPPPPGPAPALSGPESFAVLGPRPVPAIGFAFDHQAGTVSVLKMAVPPPAGMKYHLWLVTDLDGPRHITGFDATGTYPSDLLQDVNAATLAGALLVVTEEPDGPPPSTPSSVPAFSGMAVRR